MSAQARRTKVARGTRRATKAGRLVVHLTFTKAAKRRFKHTKSLSLTLTVTQGAQNSTGHLKLAR